MSPKVKRSPWRFNNWSWSSRIPYISLAGVEERMGIKSRPPVLANMHHLALKIPATLLPTHTTKTTSPVLPHWIFDPGLDESELPRSFVQLPNAQFHLPCLGPSLFIASGRICSRQSRLQSQHANHFCADPAKPPATGVWVLPRRCTVATVSRPGASRSSAG